MSFTTALRTQARLALNTCKMRRNLFALRASLLQPMASSRPFSTSRHSRIDSQATQPVNADEVSREKAPHQLKSFPPSNTIFLDGLPHNTTRKQIWELFKDRGEVFRVTMGPKDGDCFQAKYAHVHFRHIEQAIAVYEAAQEEPIVVGGEAARVAYSPTKDKSLQNPPNPRLYFKRGAFPDVMEEVLRPFSADIVSADIVWDKETRQPNGKAFFSFTNTEAAEAAYKALEEAGHVDRFHIRYATSKSG